MLCKGTKHNNEVIATSISMFGTTNYFMIIMTLLLLVWKNLNKCGSYQISSLDAGLNSTDYLHMHTEDPLID